MEHKIVFEDGTVRSFRNVVFMPYSLVADGQVFLYSEVAEVHISD